MTITSTTLLSFRAVAKEAIKTAKKTEKAAKEQAKTLATALLDKGVDLESITKILSITPKAVEKILNKK